MQLFTPLFILNSQKTFQVPIGWNGCIPLPVNDDLWIALAILIASESRKFIRSTVCMILPSDSILRLVALGLLLIKSVKHASTLKKFGSTS